jgi:hypothetical protein
MAAKQQEYVEGRWRQLVDPQKKKGRTAGNKNFDLNTMLCRKVNV